MKTIGFFNNKGGVGTTSLVYHLAWMFADRGLRVVAADLDPQASLTGLFLDDARLDALFGKGAARGTIVESLHPMVMRGEPISDPPVLDCGGVGLLAGHLALSMDEHELSVQWTLALDGAPRGFQGIAAFHQVLARAAEQQRADLVLVDVGPNLGAINRAALLAVDQLIIPLADSSLSMLELESLGPQLRGWREGWAERLKKRPPGMELPAGRLEPAGYLILQSVARLQRPMSIHSNWMTRIPSLYRESVLGETSLRGDVPADRDPSCLAILKRHESLMPLALEARKPMFALNPADGALGSHARAVRDCYSDFQILTTKIAERAGVTLPGSS